MRHQPDGHSANWNTLCMQVDPKHFFWSWCIRNIPFVLVPGYTEKAMGRGTLKEFVVAEQLAKFYGLGLHLSNVKVIPNTSLGFQEGILLYPLSEGDHSTTLKDIVQGHLLNSRQWVHDRLIAQIANDLHEWGIIRSFTDTLYTFVLSMSKSSPLWPEFVGRVPFDVWVGSESRTPREDFREVLHMFGLSEVAHRVEPFFDPRLATKGSCTLVASPDVPHDQNLHKSVALWMGLNPRTSQVEEIVREVLSIQSQNPLDNDLQDALFDTR